MISKNVDKIIKIQKLPSGSTAMALETSQGTLALEVGSGIIFLNKDGIYPFIRMLKEVDKFFLKR